MTAPPLMAPTPTMSLLLTLFTPLLVTAPLIMASIVSTVWHRALVTQDQLTAANTFQTFPVSEEVKCAMLATHTPWCHLFTHNASGCALYDLLVDSLADPPPAGQAVAACKTRHRNGEVLGYWWVCCAPHWRYSHGFVTNTFILAAYIHLYKCQLLP